MVESFSNFSIFCGLYIHIVHQRVILIASDKELRVGLNADFRASEDAFNVLDLLLGAMLMDSRTLFNLVEVR